MRNLTTTQNFQISNSPLKPTTIKTPFFRNVKPRLQHQEFDKKNHGTNTEIRSALDRVKHINRKLTTHM